MDVISVTCNHCGAPLEVAESVRFVTCRYCKSSLEIKRTASAVYTEVLERIDERTEKMAEDLAAIRRQNELEALDREWAMRRETLLVRSKNGSISEPSAGVGVVASIGAAIFGVIWTVMAASMGAPVFFPLFGVVFIGAAIFGGVRAVTHAGAYKREQELYEQRRAALMRDDERV